MHSKFIVLYRNQSRFTEDPTGTTSAVWYIVLVLQRNCYFTTATLVHSRSVCCINRQFAADTHNREERM